MPTIVELAIKAHQAGYDVVACHGQVPIFSGWQTGTRTKAEIEGWDFDPRITNVGIRCGSIVGVDIDIDDGSLSERAKNLALQVLGDTHLVRIGRAPRQLMVYRIACPMRKKIARGVLGGTEHTVEILGTGQQFVAYGIHPKILQPYVWPEADLAATPLSMVPVVTEGQVDAYITALADIIGPPKAPPKAAPSPPGGFTSNGMDHGPVDREDALEALYAIPGDLDYDEWIRVGLGLYATLGASAGNHWAAWSARSPKNVPETTAKRWPSFSQVRDIHAETLFWIARHHGWKPERERQGGDISRLGIFGGQRFSDTPDSDGVFQPIGEANPGQSRPSALPRIHLRDIKSALPPDRLIRKLLGTETLAQIYGPSGSGKSFLAMDMGLHIAMGREWFGRKVMKGAVLYVAAEGASGINNRIIGFKKKYMPDEDTPFDLVPVSVNLGPNGQDTDKVIAAAKEMEAETGLPVLLIVVDTLARAMGNGDENTAKDMGEFVDHCDRIRQATKATILIVHHTGKNQAAGSRGSSSLPAAVDTMIEVEVGDGGRIATIVKQKDGEDGIRFGFDLEVVEIGYDEDGEPITTCVTYTTDTIAKPSSKLSPQMRRALEVLTSCIAQRLVNPPNKVDFPSVALGLLEHWRNELRATGITDRNDDHKERSAFSRIKQTLDQKGFIRMRDEYVWKCATGATARNERATKK